MESSSSFESCFIIPQSRFSLRRQEGVALRKEPLKRTQGSGPHTSRTCKALWRPQGGLESPDYGESPASLVALKVRRLVSEAVDHGVLGTPAGDLLMEPLRIVSLVLSLFSRFHAETDYVDTTH